MAAQETEDIDFENTATYRLARVATAYRNALERHVGKIGLHSGQVFVLIELWKMDGLRQVDIADRLSLKAPTITKMVNALIKKKLVARKKLDDDARSSRVFLTRWGAEMRSSVNEQWVELESEYLSGLTEIERSILLDLLGKLRIAYTGRGPEEGE